jgi:hypothetical protein
LEVLEAMFLLLEALEVAGLAWDLLKWYLRLTEDRVDAVPFLVGV